MSKAATKESSKAPVKPKAGTRPTTIRSSRLEAQGDTVVAIALAGRPGAVIEHMALVSAAAAAVVFRARNDQFEIYFRSDRTESSVHDGQWP